MDRLMAIGGKLEDALAGAGAEQLTVELAEELSQDLGCSEVELYAAAATMTEIPCDSSLPIRFEVCVGGCQAWGAMEVLDHLLLKRAEFDDDRSFGIVAKRCLDKCSNAPVVLIHTPDGTAGLPAASVAALDEALQQLFE